MNSRKASRTVKTLLESTTDPEVEILQLRRQKVESKFHHTRTKLLPKSMKKVKTSLVQRVVKKIKSATDTVEKSELEGELVRTKALDHVKLANWTFETQIFKNDEYLLGKMMELGIKLPQKVEKIDYEGIDKVLSVKCYQDAVKACRSDLVLFMKKLFNEVQPVVVEEKEVKEKVRNHGKQISLRGEKSFFMDSLNADDSDAGGEDGEEVDDFEDRVAFTDDEDEEEAYGEYFKGEEGIEAENKAKGKRNRLGQVARRRLAEQMYGREAKHIKSGGLTVLEREELRKQKSQQRKERTARIKKDVAKASKFLSEQTTVNGNAVKIDAKMHPSWAAKLQQQAKIQQATFQGQKIKFDE